nr:hypothetical protein [Tanacetum cinerariifolium]
MLNPSPDVGIDSLFDSTPRVDVSVMTTVEPLLFTAPTLPPPFIPTISQVQQAPAPSPATAPSISLQDLPNFAVSSIPGIVDRYLNHRMNEVVKVAIQLQSDRLRYKAHAKNKDFLNKLDENIQKIIKEQVKEQVNVQVSKILPNIKKTVKEQLEAEVLTRASNSSKTSYAVAADISELELKKILIEKIESNNESAPAEEPMHITQDFEEPAHQEFETGATDNQPIAEGSQHPEWFQKQAKPPTPNRAWNKTLPATHGHIQPWISDQAKQADSQSLIGGANVNNSMVLQSTGNLLEMSTPNVESSLSPNFKSSNGITTSIWIGSLKVDQSHYRRILCFQRLFKNVHEKHRHPTACGRSSIRCQKLPKKLNLTNLDTYISDLKRKETYTAYYNPRRFIYQNKDKQNSLMRIDELHKFSDDTLNDVRTAMDDRLKGIRMKYLPQTIWRRSDKERAVAMIQAIDKQLKTRRIMRSLEKFVGGRLYEEDFRMLQRTI